MASLRVWTVPVERSALDPGEVRSWLSADERARADALHRDADRRSFLARRGALRRVLAGELDCAPAAVVLATDGFGKPYVRGPASCPGRITFSVSSCASLAVIAVARDVGVGVDIEDRRAIDYVAETADVILGPSERRAFERIAADLRPGVLLRVWTRKEAVLKAQGTGLLRAPEAITVLAHATEREVVLADVVDGCGVRGLDQPPDVYLSVAITSDRPPSVELFSLARPDAPAAAQPAGL